MNKRRLLLVSDTYLPQIDGTVRFIEEFVKHCKNDFEITLLVPKFSDKENKLGVKAIFLPVSRLIEPLPTYPSIKLNLGNLIKIKRAVKDSEIIFAQGPALLSYLAVYYARRYKKKAVFYTHVLPWELLDKSKSSFFWRTIAKMVRKISIYFYNKCDEVYLPYYDLEEQLKSYGIKTKTYITRLGIDIERFTLTKNKEASKKKVKIDEKKFVIGYVGRISKEKNLSILLEAFKKIEVPNISLLLVGSGADSLVNQFKETKNCVVTGFVNNVPDYLNAMDIFVMPSLTETTSLATLEAMSCGLPVIATKVGFIKSYLVKDHNGIFFPRDSATMLALKIEQLMKDSELMRTLGTNARKMVAYSFSWERSVNKIKRLLLEI